MAIAPVGPVAAPPPAARPEPPAAAAPPGASTARALLNVVQEATESAATTAQEAAHGDPQALRLEAKHHASNVASPRAGHTLSLKA